MSPRPPGDRPHSAEILNLMCARFEAALAEGTVDETLRAHEKSCERCADFSRELASVETWIAEATGPSGPLSDDFLDQVFARADALDGRLSSDTPSSSKPILPALAVGFLAAAAMLTAFWAGGASEQLRQDDHRARVRVQAPTQPAPTQVTATARPTEAMVRTPTPPPVVRSRTRIEPTVPAASPVPEPVVDLGAEIQVMLREKVTSTEGCPKHTKAPVWVTATIQPDGTLTNRSIMSAGGASDAHRCVSRALDQLLLPPGSPTTTVTFELSW